MNVCIRISIGSFQNAGVIQAAYNLNNKLRLTSVSDDTSSGQELSSFVLVDTPAVIISALKKVQNSFILKWCLLIPVTAVIYHRAMDCVIWLLVLNRCCEMLLLKRSVGGVRLPWISGKYSMSLLFVARMSIALSDAFVLLIELFISLAKLRVSLSYFTNNIISFPSI